MERFNNLNGLRAYSAIGIALMHYQANIGQKPTMGYLTDAIIPFFTNFVFLFFMISAFSMCCGYYERIMNKQVKDNLLKTINKQLDNELLYEDSYNRNYKKFKILGIKLNEENYNVYKLKTWKEHVEYLRNWLINRINWLDNYWNIQ